MTQIAFSSDGKTVAVWADITNETDDIVSFEVLNGGWLGDFYKNTETVRVNATKHEYPAKIVWRGEAPYYQSEYNEAITWIEAQL
jgi:hypothetical protein